MQGSCVVKVTFHVLPSAPSNSGGEPCVYLRIRIPNFERYQRADRGPSVHVQNTCVTDSHSTWHICQM